MKIARLFHNPKAGDEEHEKKSLVSLVEAAGYECRYSSTKKVGWEKIEDDVDFLIVAGGDGTVRKLTGELLKRKKLDKSFPIGLLPLGTANNIAKTLGLNGDSEKIIASWKNKNLKSFDVGVCSTKDISFFLESFGFGLFPYLMKEAKKLEEKEGDTPEKKLKKALKLLHEISLEYEARDCKLIIDEKDHSREYIMAEVMNIRSIGPNLLLSPDGDPGDGLMEVVTIPASEKKLFASYIEGKINDVDLKFFFKKIPASSIEISWKGTHVHYDDEIIKLKEKTPVNISIRKGLLEFLV